MKQEKKISQEEEKSQKIKKNKKGFLRYVKLRTLIILVVMLVFNTYAWFVFATKASLDLTVHVTSWNISFKVDEQESSTNIIIDAGKIYPGMPDFQKVVIVSSGGEEKAVLSYRYKSVTLLGKTYTAGEEYTEEELKNMMEVDNPFKVSVVIDQEHISEENGQGSFTITITWPFESGNDELDTEWGEKAYDFYKSNGEISSLHIGLELIAEQEKSEE